MQSSEEPVEPALAFGADRAAFQAHALGYGVYGVAEWHAGVLAGDIGSELMDASLVGGMEFLTGSGVLDEKAAFLAAAGCVLDPRYAGILLPLCHAHRIS